MRDRTMAQRAAPGRRARSHRGQRKILLRGKATHDTAISALVNVRNTLQALMTVTRQVSTTKQDVPALLRIQKAGNDAQRCGLPHAVPTS